MFKYSFWRNALKVAYWLDYVTATTAYKVEEKFFKAEIDYTSNSMSWGDFVDHEDYEEEGEL
jgi:hypothetical protein